MRCRRCGGIMVGEEFYGLDEMFSGWHCIFCGEIVDPVILQNRMTQKTSAVPSRLQTDHFEILSASDTPALGMLE